MISEGETTLTNDVDRVQRESEKEAILRVTEDRQSAKDCWLLTDPSWGGCCCICIHHVEDFSHPSTDGGSILHRRGFICASPELGSYSGWTEHSFCEMFELREDIRKGARP